MRALIATVALAVTAACTCGQVRDDGAAASADDTADETSRGTRAAPGWDEKPTLRLLIATDLQGTLEPCGCQSRPLGGIDRMAARVDALRDDGIPTLMVAAGDLWLGSKAHSAAAHGEGAELQQTRWRAETTNEILGRMGVDAATPGYGDASLGTKLLASLVDGAAFPVLGSGLRLEPSSSKEGVHESEDDAGADGATRLRSGIVRTAGDTDVGIVGVSAMRGPAGKRPEGVSASAAPLARARETASKLRRERNVDLLVALVAGDRQLGRQTATRMNGVDFVVQGGLDDPDATPPVRTNGAFLLHAGRQGQGLAVVDVWNRGQGAWNDVGAWGRREQRKRLTQRAEELEARIAEWKRDDDVADSDIETQRARLRDMKKRIDALEGTAKLPEEQNAIAARWKPLPPSEPSDDAIRKMIDAYYKRVNDHNARVLADRKPEPAPEGTASYVGSQECASCHRPEHDWWQQTPHGQAYSTLVERHKNYNLECVGCHVTGYREPGGSTVTHVEGLKNVGCESCHGPASKHVANPAPPHEAIRRKVPEPVCVQCHNPEHSDLFDYNAYLNVMIVPGHGKPLPEESQK